jgi:hypothetical protein
MEARLAFAHSGGLAPADKKGTLQSSPAVLIVNYQCVAERMQANRKPL